MPKEQAGTDDCYSKGRPSPRKDPVSGNAHWFQIKAVIDCKVLKLKTKLWIVIFPLSFVCQHPFTRAETLHFELIFIIQFQLMYNMVQIFMGLTCPVHSWLSLDLEVPDKCLWEQNVVKIFKAMKTPQCLWTLCMFVCIQKAGYLKVWSCLLMFPGQKVGCTGATVCVLHPASVSNNAHVGTN